MFIGNEHMPVIMVLRGISDNCHIVGGAVRDHLLGDKPKDIDLVCDVPYDILKDAYIDAGFKVKEAGRQYNVLHVSLNGQHYEISNYRSDMGNEGGKIGTLEEDAQRRDFTINAIYYNLHTHEYEDPNGKGLEDIRSRLLRFVGSASSRVQEDPLRVWRFYRLLQTKDLVADKRSLTAVRHMFKDATNKVSPERIRNELEKNDTRNLDEPIRRTNKDTGKDERQEGTIDVCTAAGQ